MTNSFIKSGDLYRRRFVDDNPPEEVVEVCAKLDELLALCRDRKVDIVLNNVKNGKSTLRHCHCQFKVRAVEGDDE